MFWLALYLVVWALYLALHVLPYAGRARSGGAWVAVLFGLWFALVSPLVVLWWLVVLADVLIRGEPIERRAGRMLVVYKGPGGGGYSLRLYPLSLNMNEAATSGPVLWVSDGFLRVALVYWWRGRVRIPEWYYCWR